MKIAIIGAGGIAEKAYFPLLKTWPSMEITAVYSRSKERMEKFRTIWGFSNCTTVIQAVLDSQPEAVFVITSTETHFDLCRLFLEKDIDVYSEKSLTTHSEQSHELAAIAKEHNRILMVGYNRRYALLYQQAKELFGNRRIQSALIQKHRTYLAYETLYQQFLDDTIHQIDLSRFFCGNVEALYTTFNKVDGKIASAVSVMGLPEGGQVVLAISNTAGAWQESVTIHGEGLSVHVDAFQRLIARYEDHEVVHGTDRAGEWIRDLRERGFEGEVVHFLDCVRTRENPRTDAIEAAMTQELLEQLIKVSVEGSNFAKNH